MVAGRVGRADRDPRLHDPLGGAPGARAPRRDPLFRLPLAFRRRGDLLLELRPLPLDRLRRRGVWPWERYGSAESDRGRDVRAVRADRPTSVALRLPALSRHRLWAHTRARDLAACDRGRRGWIRAAAATRSAVAAGTTTESVSPPRVKARA